MLIRDTSLCLSLSLCVRSLSSIFYMQVLHHRFISLWSLPHWRPPTFPTSSTFCTGLSTSLGLDAFSLPLLTLFSLTIRCSVGCSVLTSTDLVLPHSSVYCWAYCAHRVQCSPLLTLFSALLAVSPLLVVTSALLYLQVLSSGCAPSTWSCSICTALPLHCLQPVLQTCPLYKEFRKVIVLSVMVLLFLFVLVSLDHLRHLYMHVLEIESLLHTYVIFCMIYNLVCD